PGRADAGLVGRLDAPLHDAPHAAQPQALEGGLARPVVVARIESVAGQAQLGSGHLLDVRERGPVQQQQPRVVRAELHERRRIRVEDAGDGRRRPLVRILGVGGSRREHYGGEKHGAGGHAGVLLPGSADRIRWNALADTEVVIVGAGVVGLAIAARLAPRHTVVVLERNARPGLETSSRNSEVIHAGMYYPTGSLKARLCVEGNRRLYEICERHGVPHRRTTKIIVATTGAEQAALGEILSRGAANGVELRMITAAESRSLEPHVPSAGALFSPNTGIVSAHGLMDHFARSARAAGAVIQLRAELVGLVRDGLEWELRVRTAAEEETVTAERVVNAAGLDADTVAGLAGID